MSNTETDTGSVKYLKKNKSTVVLKSDKGNGVVVLSKLICDNSIFDIINSNKFKNLKENPMNYIT